MDKRRTSSKGEKDVDFHELLEKDAGAAHTERIRKLFDEVESASEDLSRTPGEAALREYRKRIKIFINEVLSESREVTILPRPGIYEDPYVIVKIIDEKLDELAKTVISEEIERGELSRIIEEIKGILIDLYR